MLADLLSTPLAIALLSGWSLLTAIAVVWVSGRLPSASGAGQDDHVQRIFRNSAIPIVSQLFIRGVDLLVAIAILRLLGPTGNGQYAIAVVVWLYAKTITDFGLTLLATREVARDPNIAGQIVGSTTLFRWLVLAIILVPTALYIAADLGFGGMANQSAIAIAILLLSIIPSSYGEAANSALNGLERMELAAVINVGVSLARAPLAVALGASALGVSGVALAALATSALSAVAFHRALQTLDIKTITWKLGRERARYYARESWPLLVNGLLVSLFFRLDVFVIQSIEGDRALGLYDAAYKLISLLTVIPAYATLAVFPLMSQRAHDRAALLNAQRVTTYTLVTAAWAIVVAVTALASIAIRVLAGDEYLPEAASLLRILIWFAPISFLNGVFQYVLVAAGRQRDVVPAFGAAVTFNLLANILLVPIFGTSAAAALTVATEVVIFGAFAYVSRNEPVSIADARVLRRLWRPTAAGVAGAAVALAFRDEPLLAFALSTAVFAALAWILRVIGPQETELARRVIGRRRGATPAA